MTEFSIGDTVRLDRDYDQMAAGAVGRVFGESHRSRMRIGFAEKQKDEYGALTRGWLISDQYGSTTEEKERAKGWGLVYGWSVPTDWLTKVEGADGFGNPDMISKAVVWEAAMKAAEEHDLCAVVQETLRTIGITAPKDYISDGIYARYITGSREEDVTGPDLIYFVSSSVARVYDVDGDEIDGYDTGEAVRELKSFMKPPGERGRFSFFAERLTKAPE